METAASSGAHLTSFSLVDLAAHGAACGLMNPYYAVLYTPAIQPQLKSISRVLARYGYVPEGTDSLHGRELSQAVAGGLIAFGKAIHAPTKLSDLDGFGEKHIQRILTAAKDPSLRFSESDGCLHVDKSDYFTGEMVESGRLVFKDNCIQLEGGAT